MTASSVVTFFIETPFRMVLPNMTRPRLSVLLSLSLRIGLRGQLAERDLELWLDQLGSRRLHQCIESHALLREGGPAEAELGVAALDDAALDAVARETGVVEDGLQLADPMAVVEGNAVGGPERVEDPDRLGHLAQREAHHEDVRALLAPPAPVEVALKVVAAEDDGAASSADEQGDDAAADHPGPRGRLGVCAGDHRKGDEGADEKRAAQSDYGDQDTGGRDPGARGLVVRRDRRGEPHGHDPDQGRRVRARPERDHAVRTGPLRYGVAQPREEVLPRVALDEGAGRTSFVMSL